MTLLRFFSYFGSKNEHSRRYPPPRYETIVEPFAGAAGYSTRHHERRVILVERDPVIAGIWRYLIRTPASEILRLPLLEPEQSVDSLAVCPEARALISYWLGVSGGGHKRLTKRALGQGGGSSNPEWWWSRTVRARLASQVDKIRHWRLLEGDYRAAPNVAATWHIDPPYELAGTSYRYGSSGIDYAELGAWCRERRGQVMVCENAVAKWLPFKPLHFQKTSVSAFSIEAMWTNDQEDDESKVRRRHGAERARLQLGSHRHGEGVDQKPTAERRRRAKGR